MRYFYRKAVKPELKGGYSPSHRSLTGIVSCVLGFSHLHWPVWDDNTPAHAQELVILAHRIGPAQCMRSSVYSLGIAGSSQVGMFYCP